MPATIWNGTLGDTRAGMTPQQAQYLNRPVPTVGGYFGPRNYVSAEPQQRTGARGPAAGSNPLNVYIPPTGTTGAYGQGYGYASPAPTLPSNLPDLSAYGVNTQQVQSWLNGGANSSSTPPTRGRVLYSGDPGDPVAFREYINRLNSAPAGIMYQDMATIQNYFPGAHWADEPPVSPFAPPPAPAPTSTSPAIPGLPMPGNGMPGTPSTTPTGEPAPDPFAEILDPTPYNRAVDIGHSFIGTIPTSASALLSASPALRGINPAMANELNQQWSAVGNDLQNQAGLEFARKAGTEVPQFQLQQRLGLAGLQNDWGGVQNDFYRNQVNQSTQGVNTLLNLLGAFGSFF